MISAIETKQTDNNVQAAGSDRQFGLVFAALFLIIACWPLLRLDAPRWWALLIAAAFAMTALLRPTLLQRPNRLWSALGNLLHRIVSPIVMGVIFFGFVTPTGWILGRTGKDLLSLRWDRSADSYWTERPYPPDSRQSMKQQF
jgi:hypothetical protein